jgi:hypothetical protein
LTALGIGKPTWVGTGFQQGPKSGNVSGGRSGGILFTRFRHSSTKERKILQNFICPDPELLKIPGTVRYHTELSSF